MQLTKTSLIKALRETLDDELGALGFRWRRMWRSSDGWYVRRWEAGTERIGIAVANRHPQYVLSPFVATTLDRVAELVCPCLGYVDPDAAEDFFDHDFNLSPFTKGPPGDPSCDFSVRMDDEARGVAEEIGSVVRDAVDPWLVQHRSPAAMFELVDSPWREAGPLRDPVRGMVEIALAHLASSPEEARLRTEAMERAQGWPVAERAKIEKLIAQLD